MPMCHKAYAFDRAAFERDDLPELRPAGPPPPSPPA
jgi:hypothetical protein